MLEGQQSASSGRDSENAPIFVPAGIDTTVTVLSDTTPFRRHDLRSGLPVRRCRGDARVRRSANSGIRTNYGLPCQGIRTPLSASSLYELAGKLGYTFGTGSRVGLSYLRSQNQERLLRLQPTSTTPPRFSEPVRWSEVLTLNWTQNLARPTNRALTLELDLSYQRDQSIASPLTTESELATRDPLAGFMIRPLGFLFDFDNFPLTRELVKNVRH